LLGLYYIKQSGNVQKLYLSYVSSSVSLHNAFEILKVVQPYSHMLLMCQRTRFPLALLVVQTCANRLPMPVKNHNTTT